MDKDLNEARVALRTAQSVVDRKGGDIADRVAIALGWVRVHEAASIVPVTSTGNGN